MKLRTLPVLSNSLRTAWGSRYERARTEGLIEVVETFQRLHGTPIGKPPDHYGTLPVADELETLGAQIAAMHNSYPAGDNR